MTVQLIIDNKKLDASSGKTYKRVDPLSGRTITTGAACNVEDAQQIVESSQRAFQTWSKTGPTERRRILLAAADGCGVAWTAGRVGGSYVSVLALCQDADCFPPCLLLCLLPIDILVYAIHALMLTHA